MNLPCLGVAVDANLHIVHTAPLIRTARYVYFPTDWKISRAALQLLTSFLQPLFLCFYNSHHVCARVSMCVCTATGILLQPTTPTVWCNSQGILLGGGGGGHNTRTL